MCWQHKMPKSNVDTDCMALAKNQMFQLKWNLLRNQKGLLFYDSVWFSASVFVFFFPRPLNKRALRFSQKSMRIAHNNLGVGLMKVKERSGNWNRSEPTTELLGTKLELMEIVQFELSQCVQVQHWDGTVELTCYIPGICFGRGLWYPSLAMVLH